jgi:hypothetical protein
MAVTVSQSESNFKINIKEELDGSSLITREQDQKFNGTTLKLDQEGGVNATISSDQKTTLKNSTVTTSQDDDFLVIQGKTRDSKVKASKANDDIMVEAQNEENYVVVGSTFNLGKGNDTADFQGSVEDSTFNPGEGKDTLIFGGDVIDSTIKLGNDGEIDTIIFNPNANIKGTKIEGADDGDLLIIGDNTYTYRSSEDGWFTADNQEFKF